MLKSFYKGGEEIDILALHDGQLIVILGHHERRRRGCTIRSGGLFEVGRVLLGLLFRILEGQCYCRLQICVFLLLFDSAIWFWLWSFPSCL